MDTRMIDVAIGLALVFALTSLLTTALQEVLSQWRGKRGAILRQALESFVGDDSRLAQALMDHPLLVSLSPQTQTEQGARRPSYIGADSVVAALIGHLVQTHAGGVRPQTPAELIGAVQHVASGRMSLASALGPTMPGSVSRADMAGADVVAPNPQFARGLSALVIGVEHDWPAFEARVAAWYDSVGARATGWFKRDVQKTVFMLGLLTAAVANINPIVVASRLWQDEPLRKAVVAAAERAVEANAAASAPGAPASGAAINAVLPQAAAAAAAPASAPEIGSALPGFNRTLAQAMQEAQPGSASGAVLLAVGTRALALDSARTAWQSAEAPGRAAAGQRLQAQVDELLRGLPSPPTQQALHNAHQVLRTAVAIALVAPVALASAAATPATAVSSGGSAEPAPQCTQYSDPAVRNLCVRMAGLSELQQAGLPIGWSRSARPALWEDGCDAIEAQTREPTNPRCQGWQHLVNANWWGNTLLIPLGWLITALACTLGAPFWFDALGKLVKLRASGGRPEDTNESGTLGAPAASQLARSPAAGAADSGAVAAAVAAATPATAMSDALNDAERALAFAEVQRLQRALGMAEVELSGFFDGKTRDRIKAWQTQQALLPADGELSAMQIQQLFSASTGSDGNDFLG